MKKFVFTMAFVAAALGSLLVSCHKPDPGEDVDPADAYDQILTEDGIYLAIYAFNNGIVSVYDYQLVNHQSAPLFKGWINNLSATDPGTALYYTIDSALNALNRVKFPSSLEYLNMVNFTDGIDNASVYFANNQWNTNYQSRTDYQSAIKSRLRNGLFHGHSLSAYGIGVQSSSIDQDVFRASIEDISSDDLNARVLADFSSVSTEFENIASNISSTTTMTDITLSFTCGGTDRIAIVFDGAATPAQSSCKIEATLNSDNTLSNITYTGLTSASGGTIQGVHTNGSIFSFTFKGLRTTNNVVPSTYDVRLFRYSLGVNGNTYAQDVEFNPASQTYTQTKSKTAGIILVLDVSSSLGNNFASVKEAACNFVDILANSNKSKSSK